MAYKLIRRGRWQRVAAILLLGLAFVDLTVIDLVVPQLCDDGLLAAANIAPIQTAEARFNAQPTAVIAAQDSPPQDSHSDAPPAATEEDCFCCCSHILFGYPFTAGLPPLNERASLPSIGALPSAPPQDTFHPPRRA